MKKLLTAFCTVFIFVTSYSQNDSAKTLKFLLRPYGEGGIAFIQNSYLKKAYGTNTMFYWGAGIRIGDPVTHNLLPYLQYTRAAHTTRNKITPTSQAIDSTLRIEEFNFGVMFPVKRMDPQMLRVKAAWTFAKVNDDYSGNNVSGAGAINGYGIQLGLGWEGRMGNKSRVYVDCSYDLIKTGPDSFRDYDLVKLAIGIVL